MESWRVGREKVAKEACDCQAYVLRDSPWFLSVMFAVFACGDNNLGPVVGSATELPLLTTLPDRPFNHSAEVTVAAHDGRVIVASINFRLADASNFDVGPVGEFRKRIAIHVSDDGGLSFGPAIDPGFGSDGTASGDETTDPVIRVAANGAFYLLTMRTGLMNGQGVIARSNDGLSWTTIFNGQIQDKPWLAVENENEEVWVAGVGAYWRLSFDGAIQQAIVPEFSFGHLIVDAYAELVDVDGSGPNVARARFATAGSPFEGENGQPRIPRVLEWDGTASQPRVITSLDAGEGDLGTVMAWSHGPLQDGAWIVRARRDNGRGRLLLRTEIAGEVRDVELTGENSSAFMPAAATDAYGRLHVVWYDSAGTNGRLLYAHSLGSVPWLEGFIDPVVLDANATPGDNWWPGGSTVSGGRRLREYIGLAIDDDVVHVAWTHAPEPPSRVWVTTIRPRRPN